MKVLKFGGTSIADTTRIKNVIEIIRKYNLKQTVVVVSAFAGVTNDLVDLVNKAIKQDDSYKLDSKDLKLKHTNIVTQLMPVKKEEEGNNKVSEIFRELDSLLQGIFLVKECSDKTLDYIISFGEVLSAYIISQTISSQNINCQFVDARQIIKTENRFGATKGIGAKVNFAVTNKLIVEYFSKNNKLKIVTGFIASSNEGITTTLGRNGSDYTGAIIAAALEAECLEIWKEVDGVMTADPKCVDKPLVLPSITYDEATELSHFGSKVIHPLTMIPLMKKGIPIKIKNSFNTASPGTTIHKHISTDKPTIKSVTAISNICLLQLQGNGLSAIPDASLRLFQTLLQAGINVIFISQASSQYSICIAINQDYAIHGKQLIDKVFKIEIQNKEIKPIEIKKDLCIIALVGEGMQHTIGTSGKMFTALGKNGINVIAIAQGSSELNISAVIEDKDKTKAINVLHDIFFLSGMPSVYLFIIGATGLIGTVLIKMIEKQLLTLHKLYNINIKILGVSRTKKMFFSEDEITFKNFDHMLENKGSKASIESFVDKMLKMNYSNSILVDCTSNEEIIHLYEKVLLHNISIVTPNKKGNSSSYSYYLKLKKIANQRGVKFLYETNVGAGLPIISTINDLLNSGDVILKIEAVLSGTLNYIFSNFEAPKMFSDVVKEAKGKGYTEPDPRDDLNGMDVGRKILILAREVGAKLEMANVEIQNLVPAKCMKAKNVNEFFAELENYNSHFEKMRIDAEQKNKKLRYVATFEKNTARTALIPIDSTHPFYNLKGSDNIICITSERYKYQPLVIKGPGAGADVTAAGVFADIIKIANYIKQ